MWGLLTSVQAEKERSTHASAFLAGLIGVDSGCADVFEEAHDFFAQNFRLFVQGFRRRTHTVSRHVSFLRRIVHAQDIAIDFRDAARGILDAG